MEWGIHSSLLDTTYITLKPVTSVVVHINENQVMTETKVYQHLNKTGTFRDQNSRPWLADIESRPCTKSMTHVKDLVSDHFKNVADSLWLRFG